MNCILNFVENYIAPFVGRLQITQNRYCNVIYYHDIVCSYGDGFDKMSYGFFKHQMEYISKNGYETLSFKDLDDPEKVSFCKKRVLITFDDGWRSNHDLIFDFMSQKAIKYNIFLAIGKIGTDPNYLTWDMVRKMQASGLVGFGAHTYSHVDFSRINLVDVQKEVFEANSVFVNELGHEPKDFCYPYGYYSQESHEFLEHNTEYRRIYTSRKMFSYPENDSIIFGRSAISNNQTFRIFKNKLNGYYNSTMEVENGILSPLISLKKKIRTF